MSDRVLHPQLSADDRRRHLLEGVKLFNAGRFFASHEEFEEVWRSSRPEPKELLQGLIQIAVGMVHYVERGRADVALRVLAKGRRRVERCGRVELGIDLVSVVNGVRDWETWLAVGAGAQPRALRIEILDEDALR